MSNENVDSKSLNKYCVVCEKEWGPSLDACCTPKSLVLIKKEGFFRRIPDYFDLTGRKLDAGSLHELMAKEKASVLVLSEQQRKRIYQDAWYIVATEMAKKYADDKGALDDPKKWDQSLDVGFAMITAKYSITREQLAEIDDEGKRRNWPKKTSENEEQESVSSLRPSTDQIRSRLKELQRRHIEEVLSNVRSRGVASGDIRCGPYGDEYCALQEELQRRTEKPTT